MIANDILSSNDSGKVTALVLLDLSAAFWYYRLRNFAISLQTDMGITGTALSWFRSYLAGRSQVVSCAGHTSASRPVTCGVAQGSVLGPLLFYIYTQPLEKIIKNRNIPEPIRVGRHTWQDETMKWSAHSIVSIFMKGCNIFFNNTLVQLLFMLPTQHFWRLFYDTSFTLMTDFIFMTSYIFH